MSGCGSRSGKTASSPPPAKRGERRGRRANSQHGCFHGTVSNSTFHLWSISGAWGRKRGTSTRASECTGRQERVFGSTPICSTGGKYLLPLRLRAQGTAALARAARRRNTSNNPRTARTGLGCSTPFSLAAVARSSGACSTRNATPNVNNNTPRVLFWIKRWLCVRKCGIGTHTLVYPADRSLTSCSVW